MLKSDSPKFQNMEQYSKGTPFFGPVCLCRLWYQTKLIPSAGLGPCPPYFACLFICLKAAWTWLSYLCLPIPQVARSAPSPKHPHTSCNVPTKTTCNTPNVADPKIYTVATWLANIRTQRPNCWMQTCHPPSLPPNPVVTNSNVPKYPAIYRIISSCT